MNLPLTVQKDKLNHSVWIIDATGHTISQFFYDTFKFACSYHPDAEKNAEEMARKLNHYDEILEALADLEEACTSSPAATIHDAPCRVKARELIAKTKG